LIWISVSNLNGVGLARCRRSQANTLALELDFKGLFSVKAIGITPDESKASHSS
jgi:hypothetical protein